MTSQYDSAFHTIKQLHPTLPNTSIGSTATNTVPVIVTVDSYNLPLNARSKYTVDIQQIGQFRDVVSIELIQASVPSEALTDMFVILNVNGYSKVVSNNNNARNSFCIIPFQNVGVDTYYNMRRSSTPDDNYIYYFPEPARISKLDIEFLRPGAAGFANNTTIEGGAAFNNRHHVLTFEIRTLNRVAKPDARYQGSVAGPW
jgi:hypothetical protein